MPKITYERTLTFRHVTKYEVDIPDELSSDLDDVLADYSASPALDAYVVKHGKEMSHYEYEADDEQLTVYAEEVDHVIRPDDNPEPGDRCKECGKPITWVGPSTATDWEHVE